MQLHESQRAIDLMRCSLTEQRRSSRIELPICANAVFPELSGESCTGLLRDISMSGAFFFCKQRPGLGNKVIVELATSDSINRTKLIFQGIVVRVEEARRGAAIGIAMQFTRLPSALPGRAN